MKVKLRSLMFRVWYWYVNKVDKDADLLFLNYGYEDSNEKIELDTHDEPNRYSIQLYHRLANAIDLKDKHILEVGCGRGGGLAYVSKRFSPSSALGIDLDKLAVKFGNNHYNIDGLNFEQGNAQSLTIENNTCDVVLNVESSHRYPNMDQFLSEVYRVLKPDGYFLFTDFRYDHEMPELEETLGSAGLTLLEKQMINENVVEALKFDSDRREKLVKKLSPKLLHKTALNFAGTIGSDTYNKIQSGEYVYFLYIFQKKEANGVSVLN
jgi:ubiquinone/menaquinone biosynthesis C-methylase UbiE